ncbi:MAG TPA: signal peptidase II [Gammaproteobacteria bacterium]|nr:signal peptidase II [Gammaproteobacteria bacterium]
MLVTLVLCLCIGADLSTKALVRETMAGSPPRYYISGLLRLSHWENAGTLMSVGDDLSEAARFWGFTVLMGALAVGLIMFIIIRCDLKTWYVIAGSLIAGGTLSNVIDRLWHAGRVLDFINIVITPLDIMILNLADAEIAFGAAILLLLAARRLVRH